MSLRLFEKFFTKLLDEKDILSLYTARQIADRFQTQLTACGWSRDKAAKYVYISINMAGVLYQYSFASWTLYYTTTPSGIKKLYTMIFTNPVLGLFFYLSFYFRLLVETDLTVFNTVAGAIGFTRHQEFEPRKYALEKLQHSMQTMVDNLSKYDVSEYVPYEITSLISQYMPDSKLIYKITSETISSKGIADAIEKGIPYLIQTVLVRDADIIDRVVSEPAVCVKLSVEEKTDLQEQLESILENREILLESLKAKSKRLRTQRYEQMIETKTPQGKPKCLNECKERAKTVSGCYCEGDCSSTFFNMGKPWCYVDPRKCRGKKVDMFLGKPYEYCNPKDKHKVCHTGYKYKHCAKE